MTVQEIGLRLLKARRASLRLTVYRGKLRIELDVEDQLMQVWAGTKETLEASQVPMLDCVVEGFLGAFEEDLDRPHSISLADAMDESCERHGIK